MTDDRALSEALGFVFIFSIIIMIVGVAYAFGFPGLEDTRDVERINNAERAFDVLADNIEDLAQRNAPSRATEIKLAEASLNPGDTIEIEVSIPAKDFSQATSVKPIVYQRGDGTSVRYAAGTIVRAQAAGAIVVRGMDFTITPSRAVIPVIKTRSDTGGMGGTTTVLVRTERSASSMFENTTNGNTAWLNVTTPYPNAWQQYLQDHHGIDSCSISGGETVECSFTTDHVYLSVVKIDFEFSS